MSGKRKHWFRIVRRFDKVIAELEQIIIDANSWNGLPHNQQHTPLDVEDSRVLLAEVREKHRKFLERNPEPAE